MATAATTIAITPAMATKPATGRAQAAHAAVMPANGQIDLCRMRTTAAAASADPPTSPALTAAPATRAAWPVTVSLSNSEPTLVLPHFTNWS